MTGVEGVLDQTMSRGVGFRVVLPPPKILLTITEEGRIELGDGVTMDDAARELLQASSQYVENLESDLAASRARADLLEARVAEMRATPATAWLLYEYINQGETVHGVFLSLQSAVNWLRKSSQYMWEDVGPIIPTQEGRCYRLTDRFTLIPHEVDPPPLASHDMAPRAESSEPHKNPTSIVE